MVKQPALFILLLASLLLSAGAAAEASSDEAAFCKAEDITPIAPKQGATAPAYTAGRPTRPSSRWRTGNTLTDSPVYTLPGGEDGCLRSSV